MCLEGDVEKGFWDVNSVLFLDLGDGQTCSVCENSLSSVSLLYVHFSLCVPYFKKRCLKM